MVGRVDKKLADTMIRLAKASVRAWKAKARLRKFPATRRYNDADGTDGAEAANQQERAAECTARG